MLRLTVWDVVGNALKRLPNALEHLCTFGPIGDSYDIVPLSTTGRFALISSVPPPNLGNRVAVWEISFWSKTSEAIFLKGQVFDAPSVERAAVPVNLPDHFGTIVRGLDGLMRFKIWKYESGNITSQHEWMRPEVSTLVQGTPMFIGIGGSIALMSRSKAGKLHLSIVNIQADKDLSVVFKVLNDTVETEELATLFSGAFLTYAPRGAIVAAHRNNLGVTRLTIWRASGGNSMWILHGKELVLYSHFKEGSIPPGIKESLQMNKFPQVAKGNVIGQMGNTGPSGGVHLHIHAERLFDKFLDPATFPTLAEELRKENKVGAFRPLQFKSCKAAAVSVLKVDGDNSELADLTGHGAQTFALAVLPVSQKVKLP